MRCLIKTIQLPIIAIISLLIGLSVCIRPMPHVSAAEGSYARVLKDGAIFYLSRDNSPDSAVFELTNTYYIYITNLHLEGDYYPAEYYPTSDSGYSKLIGFVLKSDVTLWEEPPSAPYYPQIFAVAKSGAPLTNRPSLAEKLEDGSDNYQLTLMYTQALVCYGKITNQAENKAYYYVIFGSQDSGTHMGYVPADKINVTLPEPHPDPLPKEPEPPVTDIPTDPNGSPSPKNPDTPAVDDKYQILLIVAICIPALFVVYLMFKPSGKKRRYNYYDDYDDTR